MKHVQRVAAPLVLLLAARAEAQVAPAEPPLADFPPLIIEAEAATAGADFSTLTDGDVTYVTVTPSDATPTSPTTAARLLTFAATLPAAGEYELYLRVRIGAGGGADDSLFYGNVFGERDPANADEWITANGLSSVGYDQPDSVVGGAIGIPLGVGFRWINLSEFNGGEAPVRFQVAEGELAQTLQLGAREDGLQIDKLAFVRSDVSQTVAELDAGLPGRILPPAPPPRACVPTGPALAANQSKWLGGVYSTPQLPNFTAYFNQVTPENAGKWGSVEGTRDVMVWTELDAAYALAQQNGFPFRFHVLIWGNQQPSWIEALPPEEQLEEIEEWFAAVAERYPDLDLIEVVNEPLHDPPSQPGGGGGNYLEALGGTGETGWDWIINAFRMARRHFPSSELLLNDYSIVNTPADVERYAQIVRLLQAEDLIDAVGEQGHAFSTGGPNDVMQASLDALAALGLPIYITELDIDGPTDEVQLRDFQRIFPLFWEHPAVAGVTLWGYRPGHWRTTQGAFLALEGGTERPALNWLREYLGSPADTPVVREQAFSVNELAAAGDVVGVARARDEGINNWLVLGGSGSELFELDAETGAITVADGAVLDAELAPELTLDIVARDECSATSVTVRVLENTAPSVAPGQAFALDSDLQLSARVVALDAEGDALTYSIIGGTGASLFSLDPETGALTPSGAIDARVDSYTLLVTASDGGLESAPETVVITLPRRVGICLQGQELVVPRAWLPFVEALGAELGGCQEPGLPWFAPLRLLVTRVLDHLE